MSLESAIEEKIKEAMARGEFDNLPGTGKPLDLDAYFSTPEDLRLAYSMLKSNEFVPAEVEIFNEIAQLTEKLSSSEIEADRAAISRKLEDRKLTLRLLMDARRRRR